jgi:hypothetical protein
MRHNDEFFKATSVHMMVMHVLCTGALDRTFAVCPLLSIARNVSSLENHIPDGDIPSSVGFRVSAAVFGTPQVKNAANSMHDKTLQEVTPTGIKISRKLRAQI